MPARERVGVRGRAADAPEANRGDGPPASLRSPSPRATGEVEMHISFPRRDFLLRALRVGTICPVSHRSELCLFPSPTASKRKRKKRKKEAERRQAQVCNLRTFRAARALQSAHACRRSAAVLAKGTAGRPRLSVRPCFRRLGRSVRSCKPAPTGGRRPRASPRALPAPTCHRPVSTSRAGHSAGRMMPEPPESGW